MNCLKKVIESQRTIHIKGVNDKFDRKRFFMTPLKDKLMKKLNQSQFTNQPIEFSVRYMRNDETSRVSSTHPVKSKDELNIRFPRVLNDLIRFNVSSTRGVTYVDCIAKE